MLSKGLPLTGQQHLSSCRQQDPTREVKLAWCYPCFPASGCRCLQEPCLADMESLPFTSAVMKEAMRLYPPAGLTTREASSDIQVGLLRDEFCAGGTGMRCSCIMSTSSQAGPVLNRSKTGLACDLASWPSVEVSSRLLACVWQLLAMSETACCVA